MPFRYNPPLNKNEIELIQETLLFWGKENFREFPWRNNYSNAFHVLISEILLRKTKAETVAPIFLKVINSYPTFSSLASANYSKLKELLKPLGLYNVRSSSLIEISKIIINDYNGKVPTAKNSISSFPHCGRYIENAFRCFHMNEKMPLVDSNIARFLSRHFGFTIPVELHKADQLWNFMETLVSEKNPRLFNYVLLDYCSAICKSQACYCDEIFGGKHV